MRTSQAASAAAPKSTHTEAAAAATSDAETEPLPFSDDEDAEGEVDDEEEDTPAAVDPPALHKSTLKLKVPARNTANMADTAGPDSLDDAAATLAGLGDFATESIPAADVSPSKTAGTDGLSDESELSDVPDEGGSEDGEGSSEEGEDQEDDNDGDSSDALGEEDDEEEEEDEEEAEDDDEEEAQNAEAPQASAARGRRSRHERDRVVHADPEEQQDDEDAASSLAALAGGATNVVAAPPAEDEEDAEADDQPGSLPTATQSANATLKSRKHSLLGPQILVDPTSNDSEPATSRQPSVEADCAEEGEDDEEEEEGDEKAGEADADGDADEEMAEAPADAEGTTSGEASKGPTSPSGEAAAGTPLPDAPELEDEAATDEAALRRTEALDALTKIELGFAMLRDRLYAERIEEVSKEGEMVLDGTHPELIHLTALIEARRQHRLRLVEIWLEEEQRHFAKMAATEERLAWQSWRHDVADLRRNSMDDLSRKRRKLEREKRNLDAPRPARRHQVFETELIGDPDLARAAARAAKADREPGVVGRRRAAREAQDLSELGSHIALPDLRGIEDYEAWSDLERMGILRPDLRMAAMGTGTHARGTPVLQAQQMPAQHPSQQQIPIHQQQQQRAQQQHPQMLDPRQQAEMAGYYVGPLDGPSAQHPGWAHEATMGYGPPMHPNGRPMTMAELNMYQEEMYAEQQYHQQQQQAAYGGHHHPHAGYPPGPSPHEIAQQQQYEREREREREREILRERERDKEREQARERERERERDRERERMSAASFNTHASHPQQRQHGERYAQAPPSPGRRAHTNNGSARYPDERESRHHYPQGASSSHQSQPQVASSARARDEREQRERETKPFANARGNRHHDEYREGPFPRQEEQPAYPSSGSSGQREQHEYQQRPLAPPQSPRRNVHAPMPQSPPQPQLPSPRGGLAPLPHRQHQAQSPSSYPHHRASHSQHQVRHPSASPQMNNRRHSDEQDGGRHFPSLPPAHSGGGLQGPHGGRSPLPPPGAGIVAAAYGSGRNPSASPAMGPSAPNTLPSPTKVPLGPKAFDNSPESRGVHEGHHGKDVDAEMSIVASGSGNVGVSGLQSNFAHRLPLSNDVKREVGPPISGPQ